MVYLMNNLAIIKNNNSIEIIMKTINLLTGLRFLLFEIETHLIQIFY
jgi:hypothetical protein